MNPAPPVIKIVFLNLYAKLKKLIFQNKLFLSTFGT